MARKRTASGSASLFGGAPEVEPPKTLQLRPQAPEPRRHLTAKDHSVIAKQRADIETERKSRKDGDIQDADMPCPVCGADREARWTTWLEDAKDRKGKVEVGVWVMRCYHCRPRAEWETSSGAS